MSRSANDQGPSIEQPLNVHLNMSEAEKALRPRNSGESERTVADPSDIESQADAETSNGDEPEEAPAVVELPSERIAPLAKYSIFTDGQKKLIVAGAVAAGFFSPLSAQIYLPALDMVASSLKVSVNQINLSVTTFMIVQAVFPMFIGSFADVAGRRPSYILCFVIYISANLGNALVQNYGGLLVLRALQAAGSSCTSTIGQALLVDITTSAERGSYVGLVALPNILAPALGPVIGGILSEYLGWRWIFWFLAILSGAYLAIFLIFMPETCRVIVGDGSIRPHPLYRPFWQLFREAFVRRGAQSKVRTEPTSQKEALRLKRPNFLQSLQILFEKEMFLLLGYSGLVYAGFYAILTSIANEFKKNFGLSGLKVGLVFLPVSVGALGTALVVGKLVDYNYRRHCRKLDIPYDRSRQGSLADFPIEKARIEPVLPFLALFAAVTIGYGWAIQYKAPLAVDIILLFLVGWAATAYQNIISALTVDMNRRTAGAAIAGFNLTRGLLGALATAVINPLIEAVGAGLAFTIFGLILIVFSPALYLVMKYGIAWRRETAEAQKAKQEKRVSEENNKAEKKSDV
ncbi:major facilitator superfamily domain-containing protein [Xylariaceae sp. FL0255]|nr:major facilitator superfamily domain-containing protein [Xylariaceae sp. FL0255]